MDANSQVAEFERLCEEKRRAELVDLKFCTKNATTLTQEEFCRQANAFDAAIEKGDCQEYSFDDASR